LSADILPVKTGDVCKTTAPVPVEDALMAIVPIINGTST
jgi:hypothetical protein